jgi:hypothetical protein
MDTQKDATENLGSSRCSRDGGWFSGDECKIMWPHKNTWYWAKDRETELIVGVGMFLPDEKMDWWFFIHGTQYPATDFDFAKACVPDCLSKTHEIHKG